MVESVPANTLAETRNKFGAHALLDVRERGEYALSHIPEACPLPRGLLEILLAELVPRTTTPIVLYCDDGHRSGLAARTCERLGYQRVHILEGGMDAWTAVGGEPEYGVNVFGKKYGEKVVADGLIDQIEPDELARRQREDDLFVLDSRTESEYRKGHIPGAFNVPSGELPSILYRLAREWDTDKPIAVHCAGRTRSILGAKFVGELGFKQAYALRNGTMAWRMSGRELETEPNELRTGPDADSAAKAAAFAAEYAASVPSVSVAELLEQRAGDQPMYVVDVRDDAAHAKGAIPGAVHCTVGQLANAADEQLAVRAAEIVCYSNTQTRAQLGASLLRRIGYPNVRWLAGGHQAWTEAGQPSEPAGRFSPPAAADVRDQVPTTNTTDGATIVDVRRSSEFALGHIHGSRWVPRGDLERRAGEAAVPGTPLVVVSDLGVRAALATLTLHELGYPDARVLDGGIQAWQGELEEGLDGARIELREAKEDAELVAKRPALLERNREDMNRYLDWEERLGKAEQ